MDKQRSNKIKMIQNKTMKALVYDGPGKIQLKDVPLPKSKKRPTYW